jgi:CubicO group peptidase (beta-lactamase class C family)
MFSPKSTIQSFMAEQIKFSGVVQVRQGRTTVFAEGYGFANRSDKLTNTINTRFGVASGTKLLTGVAICQLVEQGKLTFDSRLNEVVDIEFPNFDPAVTVFQLLTHTSGVPDYFYEEVMDDFGVLWAERPTYTIRTPSDFLPMFQNEPMKYPPGEKFSYNNGAFILLGLIIEAVSKQSYIDYVTENVLKRAEMNDSGFFLLDQLPERTALGYVDADDGSWRTNIFQIPIVGGPDGGVFMTAPDVARFWDALVTHKLLSADMTKQFLHPHVKTEPAIDESKHYGFGIWMLYENEKIIRYHGVGSDPGVSFMTSFFPDKEIDIIVISNTDSGAWAVSRGLIEIV